MVDMRGRVRAFAVLGAMCLTTLSAWAEDREHQIKAAFIYNFAKFIDWPATFQNQSGAPFTVGILGTDGFDEDLRTVLSGKSIDGHSFVIRKLDSESGVSGCRIAIIGTGDPDRIARMARWCRGTGTLLVGEAPNFAKSGGAIGFILEDGAVRFEINLDSARSSGLSISSKLLGLARKVYRSTGGLQ
jgi:hypothetical protein